MPVLDHDGPKIVVRKSGNPASHAFPSTSLGQLQGPRSCLASLWWPFGISKSFDMCESLWPEAVVSISAVQDLSRKLKIVDSCKWRHNVSYMSRSFGSQYFQPLSFAFLKPFRTPSQILFLLYGQAVLMPSVGFLNMFVVSLSLCFLIHCADQLYCNSPAGC